MEKLMDFKKSLTVRKYDGMFKKKQQNNINAQGDFP